MNLAKIERLARESVERGGMQTYENTLARAVISLLDQLSSSTRELERWRHGVPIEGDYVCPDSLELTETKRRLGEVTAARDEACEMIQKLIDAQARHSPPQVSASKEFTAMKLEIDKRIAKLRKVGAP